MQDVIIVSIDTMDKDLMREAQETLEKALGVHCIVTNFELKVMDLDSLEEKLKILLEAVRQIREEQKK